MITSKTNSNIKRIASLRERKFRTELGIFWVEGKNCVEAALNSSWEILEVSISENSSSDFNNIIESAQNKNLKIIEYSRECFLKLSALKNPEGIGAVVRKKSFKNFNDLPADNKSKTVVLYQLQSPGNMGSIIRSAVAFGFKDIIAINPSVDFFHPMTVRATSGIIFSANLYYCSEEKILRWLDDRKEFVAGLTGDGTHNINSKKEKNILVLGNEPHGLPEIFRKKYDGYAIKMDNNVESLNVNAAAAIALYEFGKK